VKIENIPTNKATAVTISHTSVFITAFKNRAKNNAHDAVLQIHIHL
jgi:hypothetical protein